MRYNVHIFTNEDARFMDAAPGNRLTFGGTVRVDSDDTYAALEAAFAVANRQGEDAIGWTWPRYVRSASVGDLFLLATEDDDGYMQGGLYEVESFDFGSRPQWAIDRSPLGVVWEVIKR